MAAKASRTKARIESLLANKRSNAMTRVWSFAWTKLGAGPGGRLFDRERLSGKRD